MINTDNTDPFYHPSILPSTLVIVDGVRQGPHGGADLNPGRFAVPSDAMA